MAINMKVGIISLGCDKNRVDTEVMISYLLKGDFEITNDKFEADVIIVNSCAFIEAARVETIDAVMEANELKEFGTLKKIILSGCMSEKYIDDIFDELKEVDGFIGTFDYSEICNCINESFEHRVNYVGICKKRDESKCEERYITTPLHYAYLKIADGCDNHCTYCIIPKIRGKYVSKNMDELVEEAKGLEQNGVRELIFVAQDVTSYGIDLYGEYKLVELIRKITSETKCKVRLLYCYPEKVSDELIDEIKNNRQVIKYIDIPLQHASDDVLKRMGRKGTYDGYLKLMKKLRRAIPEIAIRSTVMVGFPGETDDDFNTLLRFIGEADMDNCGVFKYSKEEDSASARLPDQIEEAIKIERYNKLTDLLEELSRKKKLSLIGKTVSVVYDDIDFDNNRFMGRTYASAPQIDWLVFFTSDEVVEVGNEYGVKITDIDGDDLIGETV